jgi:hypothetical protein
MDSPAEIERTDVGFRGRSDPEKVVEAVEILITVLCQSPSGEPFFPVDKLPAPSRIPP